MNEKELQDQLQPKGKLNTKKVWVTTLVIVLLVGLISGLLYWYYGMNQTNDEPAATTKTATKSASATSSATRSETDDWVEYVNPEGYKIKYPPNWLTNNEKSGAACSTDAVFFAPTKDLLGLCASGFGGIISISIISEGTIEGSHNEADYENFKKENTLIDNKQAVKVTGTWQWSNESYDYKGYKVIEYRTKLKDKIIILSYLQSPNWTDYSETFEKIVSTFKFL